MKKIYIDFDGTLFNSDKFYQDFINILEKYNLNQEEIEKIKQDLFDSLNLFNLETLLIFLIDKYNLPLNIKDDVSLLYNSSYVYKDILPCLDKLKDSYELILLTYGNKIYQDKKIKCSKLSKYFSDIIITETDKSNLLNIDYLNSIFIDNNPKEINKFLLKKCDKVIRIRRNDDKYSKFDLDNNISEYSNFYEILEHEFKIKLK